MASRIASLHSAKRAAYSPAVTAQPTLFLGPRHANFA